jgi:hypothetical protein
MKMYQVYQTFNLIYYILIQNITITVKKQNILKKSHERQINTYDDQRANGAPRAIARVTY